MQAHAELAERLNRQQQAAARQQERAQAELRALQVIRAHTQEHACGCSSPRLGQPSTVPRLAD